VQEDKQWFLKQENGVENWGLHVLEDIKKNDTNIFKQITSYKSYDDLCEYYRDQKLEYSNDEYINNIISYLVKKESDVELKEIFSKTWGGMLSRNEVNAKAYRKETNGYIISMTSSLQYIVKRISDLFSCFITFIYILDSYNQPDKEDIIKYCATIFEKHLNKLNESSPSPTDHTLVEKLPNSLRTYYSNSNISFLNSAMLFIALHEIGHHILCHTNESGSNSSLWKWFKKTKETEIDINCHIKEEEADDLAIYLAFKDITIPLCDDGFLAYAFGSIVTMIAVAYESDNPCKSSHTHPSIKDRYLKVLNALQENCTEEQYNTLINIAGIVLKWINKATGKWDNNEWWKN